MARHQITIQSAAAIAAAANFANITAAAAANFKLRRALLGSGTTTAVVPTNQQLTIGIFRATARGTQTATVAALANDPRSVAPQSAGADTTWSVQPTLAANSIIRIPLNTQATLDTAWEFNDELICDQGTANGLCFQNLTNAVPAGHVITLNAEIEE